MKINERLIEVLNDLKVNNDRVTGYEKAPEEHKKPVDLQTIFQSMAIDSRKYAAIINRFLIVDSNKLV